MAVRKGVYVAHFQYSITWRKVMGDNARKGDGEKDDNPASLAKETELWGCDTCVTELYSGLYHQPDGTVGQWVLSS